MNGYTDAAFVYNVLAQDAELDSLSYAIAAGPATATIDATGKIEWQPDATGSFDFEVLVTDTDGNEVAQSFTVDVLANAPDATPFVISEARTEIGLGQDYLSQISGTDALGRDLIWSLVDGPADIEVSADGIISFTPVAIGLQTVVLTATNADGETEEVSFELNVVGRPVINTPVIVSQPIESATIGNEYQYDVTVTGVDGELLSFTILDGPVGASIDPNLGTLRWTPVSDQLGDSDFVIEVANADGLAITQEFTVTASRFGGPPRIVSTPPTEANVGGSYLYTVGAIDAEGDPLTYRLLDAPAGLTINETTGEISWTPTADQTGLQTTVIEVVDGFGGATTQAFAILVGDGIVNEAPSIESEAPRFTAVGSDYSYQVVATDPEGTDLTYEISRGPAGLTISDAGLVSFTPADGQAGQFVVTIRVTDAGGATSIESYELDVLAENRAPVITSVAPSALVQGVDLRYDVLVSDADLDPFAFELIEAPAGTTINAFGQIVLENTSDLPLGDYDFEVRVSDPRGGEATQSFTVELQADTEGPRVSLVENLGDGSRNIFPWQGPFVVFARAIDNVAVASLTLTANGENIPLSADGSATFTFEEYGFSRITATATAVDTSGNISTETISFDYDFPEGFTGAPGQTLPTAIITSPQDAGTAVGFVSITGTANHEEFESYRLSYRLIDDPNFTEILRSETAVVNGELGVWDTSLLRNDEYVLRLEVANSEGVVNVVENNVGLAGDLKLGNFQLAFTDLVIPVAGIPIQITRIYDTLQADVEGEFGFGWRLEFRDTNLQVGLPKSGLEDIGIYSALRPGVKVYLNVPGQGRQGFTFNPEIRALGGFGGDNLVLARPRFTPDPGVTATLSTGISNFLLVNEQGELMAPGNIPYNPASPDFGGAYVVTTQEGITYRINGASGLLDSATDRNGNRITFTEGGVSAEGVGEVEFRRDSQGRIAEIIDLAGNSIQYQYDGAGDLVAVNDLTGVEVTYTYSSERSHFLESVIDPLGREVNRINYNADGRLESIRDVRGAEVGSTFDPDNFVGEVIDPLGNVFLYEYDDFGNIVSVTDALGNQTFNTYDTSQNIISTTDTLGNTSNIERDRFGNVLSTTDAAGNTVRFTYDSQGNLTNTVDSLGRLTQFVYDSAGNVIEVVNAAGDSTRFTYDNQGNLISSEDSDGNISTSEFDRFGNAKAVTDNLGNTRNFSFNALGQNIGNSVEIVSDSGEVTTVAVSFELDPNGNEVASTDAFGNTTRRELDANGRPTAIITADGRRADLIGSDTPVPGEVTLDGQSILHEFNLNNQAVAITGPDGNIERYEYDAVGNATRRILPDDTPDDLTDNASVGFEYDSLRRVIATTDANGNRTEFEYDAVGNQTVVRDGLGNELTTEYDAVGQAIRQTDPLGRVVEFEYNLLGQVTKTIFPDGSVLEQAYDQLGNLVSAIDPSGSETRFEYDAENQLVAVVDANGNRTEYERDQFGNVILQRDALGRETEFEFDEHARVTATTRPLGQQETFTYTSNNTLEQLTDFNGQTTDLIYDDQNRLESVSYADGNTTSYEYDVRGSVTSIADERGTTTFSYDEQGRLVERIEPDGRFIRYEYDGNSNVTALTTPTGTTSYTYDALNRIESVTDADGSTTEYTYDNGGNNTQISFGNRTVENRTYDLLNRLVGTELRSPADELILSVEYTRDVRGVVTEIRNSSGRVSTYEYDANGQLIQENNFTPELGTRSIGYVYDKVGNRISKIDSAVGITNFGYDDNDRLIRTTGAESTSYEFDNNGNLIESISANGDESNYSFDSRDRLVEATITVDGTTQEVT